MAEPLHKRYGMTREEWANLDDEARRALTVQFWVTLPCDICQKPVMTLLSAEPGETKTWCMEHAGTWKEEGK